MNQFKSWRYRLRLAADDNMPAIFVDLQHWREQLQTALTDGSIATRIKALGNLKEWPSIIAKVLARIERKEKAMHVLERVLADLFAEKLDNEIITRALQSPGIADAWPGEKQVCTLGLLDTYSQAVTQKNIHIWLYDHSGDPDVIALDKAHKPLRTEKDPLRFFLGSQAAVGIRDVWKLVGVVAPLYRDIYQRGISREELLAILRDDGFTKILFTFAISAAEVVDPLQKEMVMPAVDFSEVVIFNPRYFTLQQSGKRTKLQFSPYFYERLKALEPEKAKSPIFTGCPLTYLATKGNQKKSYIGALANWCIDLAEVHYVPLFPEESR